MTDAILVKAGVVDVVLRNSDDPGAFGDDHGGEVFIVDSALGVCGGQLWDGEEASDPPPPVLTLAQRKAALADLARRRRWEHEVGGVTVGGVPVRTDEKSQAKLSGAVALFGLDPGLTSIDWEAAPGVFATLDKATVEAIGVAVGHHVQACFARSKALNTAIVGAASHAALDAVEATLDTGWP
jgi:hypothetical protein